MEKYTIFRLTFTTSYRYLKKKSTDKPAKLIGHTIKRHKKKKEIYHSLIHMYRFIKYIHRYLRSLISTVGRSKHCHKSETRKLLRCLLIIEIQKISYRSEAKYLKIGI